MCDCVSRVEGEIKDHVQGDFKKPIKDVRLAGKVLSFEDGKTTTTSVFNIELEGQKRIETVKLAHSFCPFCGEKM
jgi:hypothetical protein